MSEITAGLLYLNLIGLLLQTCCCLSQQKGNNLYIFEVQSCEKVFIIQVTSQKQYIILVVSD